ncbi:Fur-regulated basic protein FbpA [Neobacillus sp. PS3-12]|uniref:Fur-regulated basic protein FbpA n=1 Tax=Neobacillus sp. PS3-12 TaxID=3070677 RepID=UPI0027E14BE6|nr:Fur-regulated basic protein FbpA [Neobacillus sp. PS3-12]WML53661.1 Fur-regulated basic protein FbpA [Neobacillus sp. PS3-12]
MEHLLKSKIQQKRQYLIEKLIKSGIYKKNNKHLYEWTLSDLEREYKSVENNLTFK